MATLNTPPPQTPSALGSVWSVWPTGAVALCLLLAFTASAEPSPHGAWACEHQKPDGTTTQNCAVTVELNGEAYLVKWTVEGHTWEGTGVLQSGRFAVAFVDTKRNVFGIALYAHDAGRWVGQWSVSGNPRLWSEVWTLR